MSDPKLLRLVCDTAALRKMGRVPGCARQPGRTVHLIGFAAEGWLFFISLIWIKADSWLAGIFLPSIAFNKAAKEDLNQF